MKVVEVYFVLSLLLVQSVVVNSVEFEGQCQTPEKSNGICLGMRNCSYYVNVLLEKPIPQSIIKTLKKSVCGIRESKPLICCPSDTLPFVSSTSPQPPITEVINEDSKEKCKSPSGEDGRCIAIKECPVLSALFEGNITSPTTLALAQRSFCGFVETEALFCCPLTPQNEFSEHKNIGLLNQNNCGPAKGSRYLENPRNETEVFDFPWVAFLFSDRSSNASYSCLGAIINKRYIITAARCIAGRHKPISVRLGEHNLEKEIDCVDDSCAPPPQNIDVEETIPHPEYVGNPKFINDIALVRLSKDTQFNSDAVQPVCLPIGIPHQIKDFENKRLVVTGLQATFDSSPILLNDVVQGVSHEKCSKSYENVISISPVIHLCVQGGGKGYCLGRGATPLVYYEEFLGRRIATLQGISAVARSLCSETNIVIYTFISPYIKWILDTLKP